MDVTLDKINGVSVLQKRNGYRFSIDAVLLANFINLSYPKKIADFGAGSGIVGLLLAKRYATAEVTLIELQEDLFNLSRQNIELNGLLERVRAVHLDIRLIKESELVQNSYDLIVSNPPYRKPNSGRLSPNGERAVARHETLLSVAELIESAFYILRARGRLVIIYHPCRFVEILELLRKKRLEPKRVQFIHADLKSQAKMFLIEAVKEGKPDFTLERPLFIYDKNGRYEAS